MDHRFDSLTLEQLDEVSTYDSFFFQPSVLAQLYSINTKILTYFFMPFNHPNY